MKINRLSVYIFILHIIFLLIFLPCSSNADPLDNWHWRSPLPTGNTLNGVTYGNGTFVAVGEKGTIFTSPDGVTWTQRSYDIKSSLQDVTYGNGIFVAVGWRQGTKRADGFYDDDYIILTSPDGIKWTIRIISSGTNYFLADVTYGNGIFVAVGRRTWNGMMFEGHEDGIILTSPDGIKWTIGSYVTDHNLNAVTFANGIFVAVGDSGIIFTSPDGVTWTQRSYSISDHLTDVTYANGTFVAVIGYYVYTSPDGVTWTQRRTYLNDDLNAVTYANGSFVAVGWSVCTSPDGVTWTQSTYEPAELNALRGVAYGSDIFVAVGDDGIIFTSPDGINWTRRSFVTTSNLLDITYGNGTFVAVGGEFSTGGIILTSPDGVTWIERDSGNSAQLNGVTYGNGTFVAVGEDGSILTSLDGVTWIERDFGFFFSLNAVTFANGIFVTVGDDGIIFTSPDGINWTIRSSGTPAQLNGVTYGNGTFVAVGWGALLTSPDGVVWTIINIGSPCPTTIYVLYDVTYGNGTFVAVGNLWYWGLGPAPDLLLCKVNLSSSDGVTWTQIDTYFRFNGVTYGNGTFVAVSDTILTSPDGINWTQRTYETNEGYCLYDVTYGNGTFVAVGSTGTTLQTDPLAGQLSPDIKANNSDGPVTLNTNNRLSLDVALETGSSGINADWWIVAYTPFGLFYYVYPEGWYYASALEHAQPAYQGTLFNLAPFEVLNITGLPAGEYAFYFGIDTIMNGHIDFDYLYFDYVGTEIFN